MTPFPCFIALSKYFLPLIEMDFEKKEEGKEKNWIKLCIKY
jgi:hypothetical protein